MVVFVLPNELNEKGINRANLARYGLIELAAGENFTAYAVSKDALEEGRSRIPQLGNILGINLCTSDLQTMLPLVSSVDSLEYIGMPPEVIRRGRFFTTDLRKIIINTLTNQT